MAILTKHKIIETNAMLLLVLSFLVVTIGGLVQIVPLFYLENTIEKVEGMRPYSPLELQGREVYIREGCYVCHSQMIRPMRDEVERYGHYSLAAESMYDHPFQWGSKRTGPDLARVGGRYSDDWHIIHLRDPQSVVPESVMPKYGFLEETLIQPEYIRDLMKTHKLVDDQESVRKARRSPIERPLRNPYWRSEIRLEDDRCLRTFLLRIVSKTLERQKSKAIGR